MLALSLAHCKLESWCGRAKRKTGHVKDWGKFRHTHNHKEAHVPFAEEGRNGFPPTAKKMRWDLPLHVMEEACDNLLSNSPPTVNAFYITGVRTGRVCVQTCRCYGQECDLIQLNAFLQVKHSLDFKGLLYYYPPDYPLLFQVCISAYGGCQGRLAYFRILTFTLPCFLEAK